MRHMPIAPRCSGCESPLRVGELVGVDEDSGIILCCLCLDLKTCRLTEVDGVVDRADSDERSRIGS